MELRRGRGPPPKPWANCSRIGVANCQGRRPRGEGRQTTGTTRGAGPVKGQCPRTVEGSVARPPTLAVPSDVNAFEEYAAKVRAPLGERLASSFRVEQPAPELTRRFPSPSACRRPHDRSLTTYNDGHQMPKGIPQPPPSGISRRPRAERSEVSEWSQQANAPLGTTKAWCTAHGGCSSPLASAIRSLP